MRIKKFKKLGAAFLAMMMLACTFTTQAAPAVEVAPFFTPVVVAEADFETGMDRVVPRGAVSLTRTSERANTGEYSLFVSGRTGASWNGASLPLAGIVQPGATYRFVAYMAAADNVGGNYVMAGEFNAGSGADNQWPWIGNSYLTVEQGFTRFVGEVTMPAGMTSFNLNFEHQQTGVDFYVDSITVTRIVPALDETLPPGFRRVNETLALTPLHETWADYFVIGNISNPGWQNDFRGEVLAHHFRAVTAENHMKPDHIQREQGVFTFGGANQIVDHAAENGLEVIGHTLLWHSQSFPWFIPMNPTREQAIEIMRTHFETTMNHFNDRHPGLVTAWDVVNEAIAPRQGFDPTDWRLHLRDTKWLRAFETGAGDGWEYLVYAFNIAHEIDPDAILYYNDYNCNDYFKATIMKYMVQELRDMGVPIHRIGMQGHYNIQTPVSSIRTSVERFRQITGCESLPPIRISFTEIDVTVPGFPAPPYGDVERLPREIEIRQAQVYAQLFQILRDHADVIERATFWGMTDRTSWRRVDHPNIFCREFGPKYAFFAVQDPDAFLLAHPLPEIADYMTAVALPVSEETRPVIGEFNRAAWAGAERLVVAQQMTAHNGATANAWVVWEDDAIYVLADINDRTFSVSHPYFHEQDSFEIFLSNTNSKVARYMPGDYQLRFSRTGVHSYGSTGTIEGMTFAVRDLGTSYTVEVRIPLRGDVYAGRIVGFDLQVNDAWYVGGQPGRQAFSNWNDHTDMGWQSTLYWGALLLGGEGTVAPGCDDDCDCYDCVVIGCPIDCDCEDCVDPVVYTLIDVVPTAVVTQLPGAQNHMVVTITEIWCNGTEQFEVVYGYNDTMKDNNSDYIIEVGSRQVFVSVRGNTQVREIYIVE